MLGRIETKIAGKYMAMCDWFFEKKVRIYALALIVLLLITSIAYARLSEQKRWREATGTPVVVSQEEAVELGWIKYIGTEEHGK